MAGDCLQLLSGGVRAAVFPHPAERLSGDIGECCAYILANVALYVSLQRHGMKPTRKGVPQHDRGEGARLDSIGFRPEETKIGGVLPHRLCEPLLAPEERPSKGGGVAMFAPMLLQDGEDFARGVDFVCPHGQHFLLGPTLQRAEKPGSGYRVDHGP